MHDLGSGDHKRAPEWIDVQSHAAIDKKCSRSPLKRPQPWCCSREDRPGEENGSNWLKYRWKPGYCQAGITNLEYEKIEIQAVKCR